MKHCCKSIRAQIEYSCEQHPDPFECPDNLIHYSDKFDEYGIIIHDGGSSVSSITHCPWCGTLLPESQRDRWFDELAALGFDDPSEQEIPLAYKNGEWRRA